MRYPRSLPSVALAALVWAGVAGGAALGKSGASYDVDEATISARAYTHGQPTRTDKKRRRTGPTRWPTSGS
jgi:hypothetical protein